MKKLQKIASSRTGKQIFALAMCMALAFCLAVPCFATDDETTALAFNFDASEMFSWTNMMLDAMMPVVYITLGISLCFIIVGALKSAFSR